MATEDEEDVTNTDNFLWNLGKVAGNWNSGRNNKATGWVQMSACRRRQVNLLQCFLNAPLPSLFLLHIDGATAAADSRVVHSGLSTRLFWALGLLDFRSARPGASASITVPGAVLGAVTEEIYVL
jgi:hypothetical protein